MSNIDEPTLSKSSSRPKTPNRSSPLVPKLKMKQNQLQLPQKKRSTSPQIQLSPRTKKERQSILFKTHFKLNEEDVEDNRKTQTQTMLPTEYMLQAEKREEELLKLEALEKEKEKERQVLEMNEVPIEEIASDCSSIHSSPFSSITLDSIDDIRGESLSDSNSQLNESIDSSKPFRPVLKKPITVEKVGKRKGEENESNVQRKTSLGISKRTQLAEDSGDYQSIQQNHIQINHQQLYLRHLLQS